MADNEEEWAGEGEETGDESAPPTSGLENTTGDEQMSDGRYNEYDGEGADENEGGLQGDAFEDDEEDESEFDELGEDDEDEDEDEDVIFLLLVYFCRL